MRLDRRLETASASASNGSAGRGAGEERSAASRADARRPERSRTSSLIHPFVILDSWVQPRSLLVIRAPTIGDGFALPGPLLVTGADEFDPDASWVGGDVR